MNDFKPGTGPVAPSPGDPIDSDPVETSPLGVKPLWPGHSAHPDRPARSEDAEPSPTAAHGLLGTDDAGGRVADIMDRARERNLGRAEELAGWVKAAEQGELTHDGRLVAAEVAHQLAGSAGTFGYQAATDRAREIEGIFAEEQPAEAWERAADCVQDLVRRLHEPPEGGSVR
ncbi:Hpt domain-containing protein [Microlunatus soli]|uniref:Hpt domain-containing protein n=1 Tax=Microlunatus soli TaxID=630515 RepID=A0A1H1WV94_9ACTN|nr:Hpt domain-containing protein [Microlunatus soli]SDT00922.1 Hpt domain-containing protein [Microlunatus soli]